MTVASLAVGIVALLLAGASLSWQIYSWQSSGSRLRVEATSFRTVGPPLGHRAYVAISVTNVGRMSTQLQMVGFDIPSGDILVSPEPALPMAGSFNRKLDAGETFTYPIEIESLRGAMAEHDVSARQLTPFASSGHGRYTGPMKSAALELLAR